MRKKRFSVEQMIGVLKQAEVGVPVAELIRKAVSVAGWPSRLRLGLFAHWYGAEDMPCQGCEWMGEAEAGRKKAHRFRSVEEKRRIVEETLKAGVSVSSVSRAHGINANQVFQWRKRGGVAGLLIVAVCGCVHDFGCGHNLYEWMG